MSIPKTWFEIISELFVNISVGWLAVVFIEPQIGVKNVWLLLDL